MLPWKHLFLAFALIAVPVLPATAQAPQSSSQPNSSAPKAHRSIPDDNLAYPVLVMFKGSEGSGFFLNAKDSVYLVTAKHVLFDPQTKQLRDKTVQLLAYSKDPGHPEDNIAILDLETLEKAGNIKWHPMQDVAVVRLGIVKPAEEKGPTSSDQKTTETLEGKYLFDTVPGAGFAKTSPSGIVGVELKNVSPFSDVLVGNDVIVFGYPTSLGLAQNPQLDPRRPLLRKGMVAGLNTQKQSIILDCAIYFGNSGGPVIQIEQSNPFQTHFAVIGVVSEYVPFADQGRTFITSRVEEGRGIRFDIVEASRFPSPLIKPDVRVSRIRLSDWLHLTAHGGGPIWTRRRCNTPSVPKTASLLKRLVPRVGTL